MKLHITNLSDRVKTAELREFLGKFGLIESVKILKNQRDEEAPGHAIVEMSSRDDAGRVVSALNGKVFEGQALKVVKGAH